MSILFSETFHLFSEPSYISEAEPVEACVDYSTELNCSGDVSRALRLEYVDDGLSMAGAAKLNDEAAKLVARRRREIERTIKTSLAECGLDRRALAQMAAEKLGASNLNAIFRDVVDPFLETGYCRNESLREMLMNLLHLSAGDILLATPDLELLNRRIGCLESSQLNAFVRHFDILWANREGICAAPELANIRIRGAGCFVGGDLGVTLGQLLYVYNRGLLRGDLCETCHCSTFKFFYVGSALSGSGQAKGFCPKCHEQKLLPIDRSWRALREYQPPFDRKTPTVWTVTTLLHALGVDLQNT